MTQFAQYSGPFILLKEIKKYIIQHIRSKDLQWINSFFLNSTDLIPTCAGNLDTGRPAFLVSLVSQASGSMFKPPSLDACREEIRQLVHGRASLNSKLCGQSNKHKQTQILSHAKSERVQTKYSTTTFIKNVGLTILFLHA